MEWHPLKREFSLLIRLRESPLSVKTISPQQSSSDFLKNIHEQSIKIMASEYLSRRDFAAAKAKLLPPGEGEANAALQRLLDGELDGRCYVNLRRSNLENRTAASPDCLA